MQTLFSPAIEVPSPGASALTLALFNVAAGHLIRECGRARMSLSEVSARAGELGLTAETLKLLHSTGALKTLSDGTVVPEWSVIRSAVVLG